MPKSDEWEVGELSNNFRPHISTLALITTPFYASNTDAMLSMIKKKKKQLKNAKNYFILHQLLPNTARFGCLLEVIVYFSLKTRSFCYGFDELCRILAIFCRTWFLYYHMKYSAVQIKTRTFNIWRVASHRYNSVSSLLYRQIHWTLLWLWNCPFNGRRPQIKCQINWKFNQQEVCLYSLDTVTQTRGQKRHKETHCDFVFFFLSKFKLTLRWMSRLIRC